MKLKGKHDNRIVSFLTGDVKPVSRMTDVHYGHTVAVQIDLNTLDKIEFLITAANRTDLDRAFVALRKAFQGSMQGVHGRSKEGYDIHLTALTHQDNVIMDDDEL